MEISSEHFSTDYLIDTQEKMEYKNFIELLWFPNNEILKFRTLTSNSFFQIQN